MNGRIIVQLPPGGQLEGIGQALRRAYPMPAPDAEEQAERHELRKLEIREAIHERR